MPLISVSAVYDGEQVRLLETPPVDRPYRVVVTFIEPTEDQEAPRDTEGFWASFGAWADERPIEATLRNLHETRRSKPTPPAV